MANSREEILRTIRTRTVPTAPLPQPFTVGIQYEDPRKQFCEALAFVGGASIIARDLASANQELQKIPVLANAKKICSLVPGLGPSNVDLDSIDDPHLLEDVDVAILPGKFGVAENGAIWLPTALLRQRVLPFITQHLVLVIPAAELVHNMHQAYERIQFEGAGFGAFISGPSKTADIEQSLVIGAHGARSMTAILCEECVDLLPSAW